MLLIYIIIKKETVHYLDVLLHVCNTFAVFDIQ